MTSACLKMATRGGGGGGKGDYSGKIGKFEEEKGKRKEGQKEKEGEG